MKVALWVVLACLLTAACRNHAVERLPRSTSSSAAAAAATGPIPTSAQLVRDYQGKIERDDHTRSWLYLQIKEATPSPTGVFFKYTLNSAEYRQDGNGDNPGLLDSSGRITFGAFRGHAHMEGSRVVLETEGIDGPPYWHLVGPAVSQ